jgi:O-antigen/teichoic acid export membrane protein
MMRSAGIYFATRVLAAVCGLLAVAIYTRLATPDVYGVFTLVMTGRSPFSRSASIGFRVPC